MDPGQLLSERAGWWIWNLIVFVISTSGRNLIGLTVYLHKVQIDALRLYFMCACKCVALHRSLKGTCSEKVESIYFGIWWNYQLKNTILEFCPGTHIYLHENVFMFAEETFITLKA